MVKWLIKYGIWILLVISIYIVLTAEFQILCIIKLPLSEDTIQKLNSIGKNISLSYIAGVIFYILSELLPFFRKRKFLKIKLKLQLDNLRSSISSFFECICGDRNPNDAKKVFFEVCKSEYEGEGVCNINKSHLFCIRRLLADIDDTLEILINSDVYLEEGDFNKVITIKTSQTLMALREVAQLRDETQIDQKSFLICCRES